MFASRDPSSNEALGRALAVCVASAALFAPGALANERELEDDAPARSAGEIATAIERMNPTEPEKPPAVFPWLLGKLQDLPPFLADTQLELRFRTYYLDQDRSSGQHSEAWAAGGSIYYRSGWLRDRLRLEAEGFTSQPLVAPEELGGTLLLEPVQHGYSVLGIANASLRYRGLVLTGYRQYLDLPYLNRNDSRMTPNTFEAIALAKPDGAFRFVGGYAWRVKLRNSDDFESIGRAIGLEKDRGNLFAGVIWNPRENLHIGTYAGGVRDVGYRTYSELGAGRDLAHGWNARIDAQFGYLWDAGDDLLGDAVDDTWNLAVRAAVSRSGAVFRLGFGVASPHGQDENRLGSTPSYTDLMQRTFDATDEKALLASLSYDFAGIGAGGLSAILNFAAGFDAQTSSGRSDAQELDLTFDYRPKRGWLRNLWLRVRASWLHEASADRDGTDVRVILRYDFQAI